MQQLTGYTNWVPGGSNFNTKILNLEKVMPLSFLFYNNCSGDLYINSLGYQSGNVSRFRTPSRSGNISVHFSGVHNQFVEGNIHAGAYLTNFYTGFSQVKANNQWWHFTECSVDDDSQNHIKSKSQ